MPTLHIKYLGLLYFISYDLFQNVSVFSNDKDGEQTIKKWVEELREKLPGLWSFWLLFLHICLLIYCAFSILNLNFVLFSFYIFLHRSIYNLTTFCNTSSKFQHIPTYCTTVYTDLLSLSGFMILSSISTDRSLVGGRFCFLWRIQVQWSVKVCKSCIVTVD